MTHYKEHDFNYDELLIKLFFGSLVGKGSLEITTTVIRIIRELTKE